MKNLDLYTTKDQYIASLLYAYGIQIYQTEWVDSVCFFAFKNNEQCQDIVKKYYSSNLTINPRVLFDSFKTIKSILFNSMKNVNIYDRYIKKN